MSEATAAIGPGAGATTVSRPPVAARSVSRLSSMAGSMYYTDDGEAVTPRASFDDGERDSEIESQYFSDARSNLPNQSTASFGTVSTPLATSNGASGGGFLSANHASAPANYRRTSTSTIPYGANGIVASEDAQEHLQETPRGSIDKATRDAYEREPEVAHKVTASSKLDMAENATGLVNREAGISAPLSALSASKENETVPSQDAQAATQATFIATHTEPVQPVKIPSGSSSSSSATVPNEQKRTSGSFAKEVPTKSESTSVNMNGKSSKKPWKRGKKSDDEEVTDEKASKEKQNPEDDPDLAHFTPEQKRIILAQTEIGNADRKLSYLDIYAFSSKMDLFLNAVGLIAAAASGTVQPLMTVVFGSLTTAFTAYGTAQITGTGIGPARDLLNDRTAQNALYLLYIGIGMLCATYIYMYTWVTSAERTTGKIRQAYLRAVLRQNIGFFDKLGAGEVTTRITSDMHLIQEGIGEKIPISAQFMVQFIAGFVVAFVKNWRLSIVLSAAMVPTITGTGGVMASYQAKYRTKMLAFIAEGGSLAEEVISSVRTTHAFGTQRKLAGLYDIPNAKTLGYGRRTAILTGICLGIFFFVIYGGYALAFWYGTTLLNNGQATSGELVTCLFAILIGAFSLSQLAPNLQAVGYAIGAANRVLFTIWRVPPIDSSSEEGSKPKVVGEITLRNVDFYYPSRPAVQVLNNYSITFPQGKTTALVGASGSGKSSVIGLIMRFYNIVGGEVQLDGLDINTINVRWLRSQIGYVQQEPTLFAGSIWENVAFGLVNTEHEDSSEEIKRTMVIEACKLANAHTFIEALPEGYDTKIGERGMLLSGGQKQRVSIARACVSNPPILLLDEATSALDTTSEVLVQKALDAAAEGRTTITIAHRLSTVKKASKIVVMSKGEIVEDGTHDELLDKNGAYASLVQAQTLREQETGEDLPEDTSRQEANALEEKEAREAKMGNLQRSTTGKSESSQILAQRHAEEEEEAGNRKSRGIFYLLFRMYREISEMKWYYVIGTAASILLGVVYPVFAIIFGALLGSFSSTDSDFVRSEGNRLALYMFIVALISAAAIFVQTYTFGYTSEYLSRVLRHKIFAKTMQQDIAFFDEEQHSTGALTSQISEKPQKVNAALGITLGVIIQSIFTLISGAIIGLAYAWKLSLVGIACIPLTLSAGFVRLRVVNLKDERTRKAHDSSAQVACESAAAIRTVASLTLEKNSTEKYAKSLELPMKISLHIALYSNFFFSISQALSFPVIALIFWYGSKLLADGDIRTGQFFVSLTAVIFASINAGQVFTFVPDVSSAKGAAAAIVRVFDNEIEIDAESRDGKAIDRPSGEIVFKDVHFRYPTRPGVRVLRGLNLTVKPGQFVALVGPSGCGKSTIIQLTERFYDPITGSVQLDGQDLRSLNVKEMRQAMALVSQEPTLYDGSVRFNITLGATSDVTEEDIINACKEANIWDFVNGLPEGLDTLVGGKGSQLSGGQKQRVAIARSLIRNPKVLLLDEATSALDSQSEKVVQAALDKASKNRTTIAVAHRLASIQNADIIYVLRDGVVAEQGNHQELLVKNGIYAELVQQQALEKQH